jgi:hypothetical protein
VNPTGPDPDDQAEKRDVADPEQEPAATWMAVTLGENLARSFAGPPRGEAPAHVANLPLAVGALLAALVSQRPLRCKRSRAPARRSR